MRIAAAFLLALLCIPATAATLPSLAVESDDGTVALALESVEVDVLVRGHLARTTFELTYRNDRDEDLDGSFTFPLPADAEVSELGLYFDGKLRLAEAVEAATARRAYHETVHRRVDPVLGEWSASSREFRFRVYPIPAKGRKVVHLAYDQELLDSPYVLDLRYGDGIRVQAGIDDNGKRSTVAEQQEIRIARGPDQTLLAFSAADGLWYSAEPGPKRGAGRRIAPSHATVLYDVSASAALRNERKLRAFLAAFPTMTVIPFHIDVEAPRSSLDAIAFGGATNLQGLLERLPEIAAASPSSRLVLVTDGIHTLGSSAALARAAAEVAKIGRPLTVVNASESVDDHLLRRLARTTNGWYIDLSRTSVPDAIETAMHAPDVAPRTLEIRSRHRPSGVAVGSEQERDLVRRAWARARLRELLDSGAPDEEVLAHGLAFRQITPRTSLLVLDGWRDYEQYGIRVPADLLAQRALDLEREAQAKVVRGSGSITVRTPAQAMSGRWSITGTILLDDGPLPGATIFLRGRDGEQVAVSDADGRFAFTASRDPGAVELRSELAGLNTIARRFRRLPGGSHVDVQMTVSTITETITVTCYAPQVEEVDGVYTDRSSGSFFIDKETAVRNALPTRDVRALTELAEAYADDGAVIRIVGRVLEGWGRPDLATRLFERADELEMRAGTTQTESSPELQVDAMWDTNYTDVDLHVIEPGGEEVSYKQKLSSNGGRLYEDVTGGFGPEVYTTRRMREGEYQVILSYYDDDDTQVSRKTLAHVIVRVNGERRDYLVVLAGKSERTVIATVSR